MQPRPEPIDHAPPRNRLLAHNPRGQSDRRCRRSRQVLQRVLGDQDRREKPHHARLFDLGELRVRDRDRGQAVPRRVHDVVQRGGFGEEARDLGFQRRFVAHAGRVAGDAGAGARVGGLEFGDCG